MTKREKIDELTTFKNFSKSVNIIEGYQEHLFGTLRRNAKLADTTLVFMNKGLFYQLMENAFYLFVSPGAINSDSLQKIIDNFVIALRNWTSNPKVLNH